LEGKKSKVVRRSVPTYKSGPHFKKKFEKHWSKTRRCFITIAFENVIRKVQDNQAGLKLTGIHQLLAYADYVNLLGDNIEINVEKTKYMSLSRHKNAGQNRDIEIANRSFENVSQFKYLGTTVANQNLIQEEIEFG
jgi:hypothetical protein